MDLLERIKQENEWKKRDDIQIDMLASLETPRKGSCRFLKAANISILALAENSQIMLHFLLMARYCLTKPLNSLFLLSLELAELVSGLYNGQAAAAKTYAALPSMAGENDSHESL